MTFARELRQSAKTAASAYLQFVTGRGREGFISNAFVEDDDDIAFYQHALSNIPDICYLGCGGKHNVREVYLKTHSEGTDIGNLFLVDRDTEDEPFEHPPVFRTSGYSWESHACDPRLVKRFIKRKSHPSFPVIVANRIEQQWTETSEHFAELLNRQLNIIRLSATINRRFGSSKVLLGEGAVIIDDVLRPSDLPALKLESILKEIIDTKVGQSVIDAALSNDLRSEILMRAHGKSLFRVLRSFLAKTFANLGRICRTDYNSAMHIIIDAPWDDEGFDYIRAYASNRLSGT